MQWTVWQSMVARARWEGVAYMIHIILYCYFLFSYYVACVYCLYISIGCTSCPLTVLDAIKHCPSLVTFMWVIQVVGSTEINNNIVWPSNFDITVTELGFGRALWLQTKGLAASAIWSVIVLPKNLGVVVVYGVGGACIHIKVHVNH